MKKRDPIEYYAIQCLLTILLNNVEINEKIIEENLRNNLDLVKRINKYKDNKASIQVINKIKKKSDENLELLKENSTNNKFSLEHDHLLYICLWIQSVINLGIALHDKEIDENRKKNIFEMNESFKIKIGELEITKKCLDFSNNISKEIGYILSIKQESASIKTQVDNFCLIYPLNSIINLESYFSNLNKSLDDEETEIIRLYQIFSGSFISQIDNIQFPKIISNEKTKLCSFCGCLAYKKKKAKK